MNMNWFRDWWRKHIADDHPMDDERLRYQAKRKANMGELLDGRPPKNHES